MKIVVPSSRTLNYATCKIATNKHGLSQVELFESERNGVFIFWQDFDSTNGERHVHIIEEMIGWCRDNCAEKIRPTIAQRIRLLFNDAIPKQVAHHPHAQWAEASFLIDIPDREIIVVLWYFRQPVDAAMFKMRWML